jgi:hypothetical protein
VTFSSIISTLNAQIKHLSGSVIKDTRFSVPKIKTLMLFNFLIYGN